METTIKRVLWRPNPNCYCHVWENSPDQAKEVRFSRDYLFCMKWQNLSNVFISCRVPYRPHECGQRWGMRAVRRQRTSPQVPKSCTRSNVSARPGWRKCRLDGWWLPRSRTDPPRRPVACSRRSSRWTFRPAVAPRRPGRLSGRRLHPSRSEAALPELLGIIYMLTYPSPLVYEPHPCSTLISLSRGADFSTPFPDLDPGNESNHLTFHAS